MAVIKFPGRRAGPSPTPPVDALISELTAVEIELARARLAQIKSETRQANAFWFWYCLKRVLFWGFVLWLIMSIAHAGEPGRDMTCRGLFEINHRSLGGHDRDLLTIGDPERTLCYIQDPAAVETVIATCQDKQPCRIRARVVKRDTPNGMPQTYNVLKVYSAIKDK
jgi:hypothetical protein